jgi:hypothetical protein
MENQTRIISVELADGTNIKVEATFIGERKINLTCRPFNEVTGAIASLSRELAEVLQGAKPERASVKFGLEIAVDGGKLTPLLVQGNSRNNLEITLEWGK